MRYSLQLKKFIYSQYFYGGLRIAIGISLPSVLFLVVFHYRELGFTISSGALGCCAVDMPGPLKHKRNEMLACSVIGFCAALATGVATAAAWTLWLTVVPLTFFLSLLVVFGNRWPQISFASLFMMIVTLEDHFTPVAALINASWLLLGALWYTSWSTLVSHRLATRIEQQALAESVFACADYLRARANFYDVEQPLDECYRQLVARQIDAVERQDAARDIVLRNLPKFRRGELDLHRTMLFNLFINAVDLHGIFVGAHTDYAAVREAFAGSDLLMFYRDLLRKTAADLDDVGLAVLQNRPSHQVVNAKAELRAIEYEIELLRKRNAPSVRAEAYASLVATYRRAWSAGRLITKMHRGTRQDVPRPETELRIDEELERFVSRRRVPFRQFFSNLTMSSPSFRHALRVTLAVAVGLWCGPFLPLTNAYWIVMTIVVILKPGFSLTKQRNMQRLIGTVIGCAASVALIVLIHEAHLLLLVMFVCLVMSYSLLLFNYTASVVFTSAWVLIMFHLLAPGGMRLIGERAIDTALGSIIAIGASYLFPYWEYRLMAGLVRRMLSATREFLEACWALNPMLALPPASTPDALGALGTRRKVNDASSGPAEAGGENANECAGRAARDGASAPHATPSAVLPMPAQPERNMRYRLARKDVHVAFANLGQAFARMMLEPKAQQKFVPELNDLLQQSHVLASHIAAVAPLLLSCVPIAHAMAQTPLQHTLGAVRNNLAQAQAGAPVIVDEQALRVKTLTRELDDMVSAAEASPEVPTEVSHDLKLLAHQCKQMLAASYLMRKDTAQIQLPVDA